jgi:hypothetical protein
VLPWHLVRHLYWVITRTRRHYGRSLFSTIKRSPFCVSTREQVSGSLGAKETNYSRSDFRLLVWMSAMQPIFSL